MAKNKAGSDHAVDAAVKPSLILTIDVGSSSIRCLAHEWRSNFSSSSTMTAVGPCQSLPAVVSRGPTLTPRGFVRQGVFDRIDRCVEKMLQQLRESVEEGVEICGLGMTTFAMSLVAVGTDGQIVPMKNNDDGIVSLTYACSSPPVIQKSQELLRSLQTRDSWNQNQQQTNQDDSLENMHQQTGVPSYLHPAYALSQLTVLMGDEEEEVDVKIAQWHSIASYCLTRWMHDSVDVKSNSNSTHKISWAEASWTGLLNIRRTKWEESLLHAFLPNPTVTTTSLALPAPVVGGSSTSFTMKKGGDGKDEKEQQSNRYWVQWPELRATRFFLGMPDGVCANLGSGCTSPFQVAVTIGTSAAVRILLPFREDLQIPPGLFAYRIAQDSVLVGGALTDGGSLVEWMQSFVGTDDWNKCLQQVEESYRCKGPQQALTVLPFWSGERSTGFRMGATGGILGFTRATTPAHMLQACLESVVLRLHAILVRLLSLVENREHCCIVASGSALERSVVWRQMLADCTRLQVHSSSCEGEETSRGMALFVAEWLKGSSKVPESSHSLSRETRCCITPQVAHKEAWTAALKRQEAALQAVSPLWETKAAQQTT